MNPTKSWVLLDSVRREIKLNQELLNFLQQQEFTGILEWFKNLCGHLSKTILLISKYHKCQRLDESVKESLLLYLWQIVTALAHLINIFVKENEIKQNLQLSRDYTKRQLLGCLEGILEILLSNSTLSQPPNFLKLMDYALNKMDDIQEILKNKDSLSEGLQNCFMDAKACIEDVLCHSMSIAQVILKSDYVIVKGKVQMVLEVLELLSTELTKENPNTSMIKLYTDSCSDKLCSLERVLNTAVLKLTLKVFGEFREPLQSICDACDRRDNFESTQDFDTLVANFDLHVDRIMQIGLFAAACSVNENRAIKIRSCLASLESLETELVPAVTATLSHHSVQNFNNFSLLKMHWLIQAELLKKYIYLIIDPFAFCQVIFLETKQVIDQYQDSLRSYTRESVHDHVNNLLKLANILKEFMTVICSENEAEAERTIIFFKDFLKVLNELESAKGVLLNELSFNPENNLRMLKRCKILQTQIKKILQCFHEENENSMEESAKNAAENSSENVENISTNSNPFLAHIINKGKEILKDRSVLYKTPQKGCNQTRNFDLEKKNVLKSQDNNVNIKSKNLRKLCFLKNTMIQPNNTSMDLQITDILNELTSMTSTFKT